MLMGRITKGVGGLYAVSTNEGDYICQARGLFRKQKITPLVGDYTDISVVDEDKKTGYLQEIHQRKNELLRPRAANIDLAVIVVAAVNPTINVELLDSFLITAEKQAVDVLICINKIDIATDRYYLEIEKAFTLSGYKVICLSAKNNVGVDCLKDEMQNKVSILAGPSGVGKSSIINAVFPDIEIELETGELSRKIQRGKHTTRHAKLIKISENTFVVDSPGFTSLNVADIPKEELQNYFREFAAYKNDCYYGDCLHISEHDCAVKVQIGKTIDEKRYDRYVRYVSRH